MPNVRLALYLLLIIVAVQTVPNAGHAYGKMATSPTRVDSQITQSHRLVPDEAPQLVTVDPTNVSSSTAMLPASEGTGNGYRSFFDEGLFWVFYTDGRNMSLATSSDGVTFGNVTKIRTSTNGNDFSTYFNATAHSVSYAYYPYGKAGSNLLYRTGTLNASTRNITWAAPEQTVLTVPSGIEQLQPIIAVDSGGYAWIGYNYYSSATRQGTPYVIKSSSNGGIWTTAAGFPFQLSTKAAAHVIARPIPMTNQKILVIYTYGGGKVNDRIWNGASWGQQETASSYSVSGTAAAAINQNDNVYLVYVSSANNIQYVSRIYSKGSWGPDTTVQSAVSSSTGVTLTSDNSGNLYFFWTNLSTGQIYYKLIISGVADNSPIAWLNESTYGLKNGADIVSFNAQFGSYIGVSYSICQNPTTCTGSGVKVRFAFLTLTNITWQTTPILSGATGNLFSIDNFNFSQIPLNLDLVAGTSHTITSYTPIPTTSGNRYVFMNWTNAGGLNGNSGTYTVPSTAQTVTANYNVQYNVTIADSAVWAGSSPIPLFTDNFEEYVASNVPIAGECVNSNYLGGGNSASTAATLPGCFAPYPVWVFASSAACTGATYPRSGSPPTGGGCVRWGGNSKMGPNSIVAVVTEQTQNGTNSLKLGASDWAFDKTEAEHDVTLSSFPANTLAKWSSGVWISDAVNHNGNRAVFWVAGGELIYQHGVWSYGSFKLGNHPISTDTWHTISLTVDISSQTLVSLLIDGVSPFNLNGLPAAPLKNSFGFAVIPGKTNQSIYSCNRNPSLCGESNASPTLGLYAYLDNVEIDYIPKVLPISDTNGTIVTVNGVNYGAQSMPYSQWFNGGETITYTFATAPSSSSVKRYVWVNSTSENGSFTVAGSATIVGTYVAQYNVNFGFTDYNGAIVLDPQPSIFAVTDSNGSLFTNPSSVWVAGGIARLTSVEWEGSNVLTAPNPFVAIIAGGATYYFKVGVYDESFVFTYSDQTTHFTPTKVTYVAPNGTAITLLPISPSPYDYTNYTNIMLQGGNTIVTQILYEGNDVILANATLNTFDASHMPLIGTPGQQQGFRKIVASVYLVNPSWQDSNLDTLSSPPTTYTLIAPNGTAIGPLIPGTTYWLQNGTTIVSAVTWEGTNFIPKTLFDASNVTTVCATECYGAPSVPLPIYHLDLKHVDTSGNPLAANIQLILPNSTTVTATTQSGWTNLTQVQTGNITINSPITVNSTQYTLQSSPTIDLTSNIQQTEVWSASNTVTSTETGLPAGTTWNVTFNRESELPNEPNNIFFRAPRWQ